MGIDSVLGSSHTNNIVGGSYVQNYEDWISYYDNKSVTKSFAPCPSSSIGVLRQVEKQKPEVTTEATVEETLPISPDNNNHKALDMKELEFVSPVQGAVQQARAEYMRAPSIRKKRKYRKRGCSGAKKRPARRRKKTGKKKRRTKKPVKRLSKKRQKQRRKRKRDIFND